MDTVVFLASIFNDTSSGLITNSSSILITPVLMSFLAAIVLATTYSLFIAGTTGAIHPSFFKKHRSIANQLYFLVFRLLPPYSLARLIAFRSSLIRNS